MDRASAFLRLYMIEEFETSISIMSPAILAMLFGGSARGHIRKGIEGFLTKPELRQAWAVISPNSYVSRLRDADPERF